MRNKIREANDSSSGIFPCQHGMRKIPDMTGIIWNGSLAMSA